MSDETTTVAELRRLVADFVAERHWQVFHAPKNLAMSLAIEAAELMEHFQWGSVEESRQVCRQPEKLSKVADELADVACYLLAFANAMGIDLSEAVRAKMFKNAAKYPADQSAALREIGGPVSIQFSWRRAAIVSAISTSALIGATAWGAAPMVVKATPDNGDQDVDPQQVVEIRVVFDQPMGAGASPVGGGDSFPEISGKPKWENNRTYVLPVKLVADHEYWLSINNQSFQNFRNLQGEAAVPYPIRFTTMGPKRASEQNRHAMAALRRAIDEDYSYRDRPKIDWDKQFTDYATKLESAASARRFCAVAAEMLAPAKDLHLWLQYKSSEIPTTRRRVDGNFNFKTLQKQVPELKQLSASVLSGRFDDGIAYIMIVSWEKDDELAYKAAFDALRDAADAKAMVVDVRPNSGGDETLAREFAGCFINAPAAYAKDTIRQAGKTLGPYERVVEPSRDRPKYPGKVAVLMGPANMSSCESFLLMMKQVPGCRLVGAQSYGSSGNPKRHDLGDGIRAFIPSWNDMLLDGTSIEGRGITPDEKVEAKASELMKNDPILDRALTLLRDEIEKKK